MKQIKGRVTKKKLIEWINNKFLELGIDEIIVTEISQPRWASDQIEGGCYRLCIRWERLDKTNSGSFYSYYPIGEIQAYLNNGYELWLKFDRHHIIKNIELDVRNI